MVNNAMRDQIVALKTAGVTNKEIVKHLNMGRKTVYYDWKKFQQTGTLSDERIPGRTHTVHPKTII